MKRLATLFIITFTIITSANAQLYTSYNNGSRDTYRQDRQELRDFEYEIEQFSFAMLTENTRKARNAKRKLLRNMEREINQTERALKRFDNRRNHRVSTFRYDWRTPQMHSKRNGAQQKNRSEFATLVHQLEKQERLYHRFSELKLLTRRNRIINENEHRRIMYRFSETMKDELFDQRNRNNSRRGR